MSQSFSFTLEGQKKLARAGRINTPHGEILTPMFMPVGTRASVRALDSQDLEIIKAQIILANTYHLFLRPGMTVLQKMGGIHNFMSWQGPILTDSGGFQVFSLSEAAADSVKISDTGVRFRSHLDGSEHFFTPERAIEIQQQIGADIIMAFDECTRDAASPEYAREAMERSNTWARQCFQAWEKTGRKNVYGREQALFGIIQGAMHKDLRIASAKAITKLGFTGIAVGGETIGYNMAGTVEVMSWIEELLPIDKPRYAMGLGRDPENILDAVMSGFDIFDCVAPARMARNGALYSGSLEEKNGQLFMDSAYKKQRLSIARAEFATDDRVIDKNCSCPTCQAGYSRAYLHHLHKSKELSYYRLASIHNLQFMLDLCQDVRAWILR